MEIKLNNGKLEIDGLSKEQMKTLYYKFRKDLLDSNITHYRPVAFKIFNASVSTVSSRISKMPNIGYSISELSFIFNNIIISERNGEMPESLLAAANHSMLKTDCSYMTLQGSTIGTSEEGSVLYSQKGKDTKVNLILKNQTILTNLSEELKVELILLKSKGKKDFTDNQRLVNNTDFKAMRTNYNLYDFFTIKEYRGEGFFVLNYIGDVNETVVEQILMDYFKQEEVKQCIE